MPVNWLVTEFLRVVLKWKLNLHLNEKKEKKIFDGLLQIYFEKKTQKTVQQECHDKNLAIITFLPLFQICQKNFSMLVTKNQELEALLFDQVDFCIFLSALHSSVRLLLEIKAGPDFSVCSSHSSWELAVSRRVGFFKSLQRVFSTFSTPIDLRSKKFFCLLRP